MLGWEFPPSVSGGLGVACYGLAKALNSTGVDVLFVLPKPLAKNGHSRVMGAGAVQEVREVLAATQSEVQAAVEHAMAPAPLIENQEAPVAGSSPVEHSIKYEEKTEEASEEVESVEYLQRVTFVPVDSPLQPYMSAPEYQKMVVEEIVRKGPAARWE